LGEGREGNDFGKQKFRKTLFGGMAIRYIYENPFAHSLEGMRVVLSAFLKIRLFGQTGSAEMQLCR
jgi:hypothetical protein